LRAGLPHFFPWDLQLDPLHTVGRQYRNSSALQQFCHVRSSHI
jgi:hypothetical protein